MFKKKNLIEINQNNKNKHNKNNKNNKKNIKSEKNKIFKARVIDRRSKLRDVEINARSMEEARIQALNHGRIIKISKTMAFGFKRKLTSSERFIFLNRLSTMVSSKVGMGEALALMTNTFKGNISQVSSALHRRMEEGLDLDVAMEDLGEACFPSGIVALVRAGSQGGNTGKALLDAANFEQEINDIRKNSAQGMMSAIFGFLFAGAFLVGSSFYLSPQVKESPLFRDVEMNTQAVDLLADVLGWVMLVIMFIFLILLMLGSVLKQIIPNISDKIIMKIPFYKELVLSKNSYATLYGLSMLVGSGVRIEESLKITKDNAPKGALKTDLQKAWNAIKKGDEKWPLQMSTLHATDKAALMTSSDNKQIAKTLSNLSYQYRRLYAERLAIIVPTMQLISAMLLSVTGAIMFGQIIMPMLTLTQTLSGI